MNFVFFGYSSLLELPDISLWNISKLTSYSFLFYEYLSLIFNLSNFFYECSSLISLPDISKCNANNTIHFNCPSLISLPDISK